MKSYLLAEYPVRLAHRGSRVLWPENTEPAFNGAVALGYKYIETDIRVSKDDVAMVFHDRFLDRTTNASGPISEWWFEDLRQLDTAFHFRPDAGHPLRGAGVGMLSLIEVLERFPDVHFNLDLKSDDADWAVAAALDATGAHDRVLAASFFDHRVRRFRRITGGRVATSAGPAETTAMWLASRAGRPVRHPAAAYQVPPRFQGKTVIDRKFVDVCHSAGAQVHAWTINDRDEMERLLELGVDGIVSDRPDVLNEVLDG